MAVEHHEFSNAAVRDASADCLPGRKKRVGIDTEGARKSGVLKAAADGHGWQHQYGAMFRQQFQAFRDDGFVDERIRSQWQVWTVLLDGGYGKQCDRALWTQS